MTFRTLSTDDHLFWEALLVSLGVHIFVSFKAGEFSLHYQQKHTVEIDITNMGHVGMTAPPRRVAPPAAAPKPRLAAPPKEWIKPAPNQAVTPAPIPTQPAAASPPEEEAPPPAPSEYNVGTGNATTVLSRIPQLRNLYDLRAIMQRFYPQAEREAGREGAVVLDLHIDTDGKVGAVDIVRSGGADFDAAAIQAAKLLRFTPAFLGSQRVAVKMRQAIQFKLER